MNKTHLLILAGAIVAGYALKDSLIQIKLFESAYVKGAEMGTPKAA